MKIFNYKKHGVSKNFLVAASAYRRMGIANGKHRSDFTLEALKEQYLLESKGTGKGSITIYTNPFTYGQSVLNITLSAMLEDYKDGLFTKYELKENSCAFVRKALSQHPTVLPFWST